MNELEHDWFTTQLATYLADGLLADERTRFETHAAQCESCAHELEDARAVESNLHNLFSDIQPAADFEDRMVGRFLAGKPKRRMKMHPLARSAALAAAAAVVVGAVGYFSEQAIQNGGLISPQQIAMDLQEIGDSYLGRAESPPAALAPATQPFMGSYDDADNVLLPLDEPAPQSARAVTRDAEKWDFSGGANPTTWATPTGTSFIGGGAVYGSVSHSVEVSGSNGYGLTMGRLTVDQATATAGSINGRLDRGQAISGLSSMTVNGIVSGSGGWTKTGTGALDLKDANSFTNSIDVVDGSVQGSANALGSTGGNVQLGGAIRTNGNVSTGGGSSSLVYSGNKTMTLNGAIGTNGDTFVTGGSTGAAPGLTKNGSGTMVVGLGATPARQGVTVNGGTAKLNVGSPAGSGQFAQRGGGVLSVTGGAFNYSAGSLVNGAGGVAGVTPNTGIVQSGTVDFFKPAEVVVDDSSLRRQSSAANLPALGDLSESADRLDPARSLGQREFSGAFTGARSSAINGVSTFQNSATSPRSGSQNTHTVTQSFPATRPIGNTPLVSNTGSATPLVQAFIQQSTGPNPAAAMERTELALANTQQQPTQPQQGGAAVQGQAQAQQSQPPAPAIVRRVIRDGVMEFEVDSFDSTFAVVAKITSEEGGFVVAADSDRLANGKVRGTITVRVPPDNLDTLILKLRALGDLKSQRLGSKDISKEYTDLESELRAGKAMEQRLLDMIKNAQGEVKDLLEAEKELANWRTKLEKIQGQMNYYNNLVAMATLTINAYEKDIRTPATATQSEEINTGIEAEDVDGARTAALKAIDEVKGRIIESSLQQMNAGQFAAKIIADVAPENAGQVVDRLRQIGKVARLDSQKKQTTGSGQTPPQGTSSAGVGPKVEQAPTRLIISIYNLANVAPRLTTNLNLAADDVEATYRAILARVNQAEGRVVSSKLDRQDANNVTGSIQFEVKTPDADPVLNDIRQPVQVLRLNVTENPDTANVTTTKQGFTVQIIPAAQVTPRLTTNLNLAAADVEATYASILNQVRTSGGRVITSNLNRQDATQAVGSIQFEIKSTEADALMNELRKTVQVLTLNVSENTGAANLTSLKQGFAMQIIPAAQVQPREVRALAVQTSTVDSAVQKSTAAALAAGGRVLESSMTQDENGAMIARIAYEVPLDKLESVSDVAKSQGKVRTAEASRNAQVPEGPLSRARINLTVGTGETIVPQTGGFWDTIRGGLSTSVKGLLWSLQLIIIGLCLIGPWVLMVWGGVKWMRRNKRAKAEAAA